MFGIIYIITNNINSKVYIGQTIQTLENRWKAHCRNKCSRNEMNMHIKRAILKYGKQNFSITELERCKVTELDEKEIYYIKLYNSYIEGYNSTKGGKSGTKELKLDIEQQQDCIELYKLGFSLREVAKEFNVDKATIKHLIELSNTPLRTTRTYKLSQKDREKILEDCKVLSRKEVMDKWDISKSYLSQLINGKRRI
jgi:predicted DNA-binding protein YlxM (UPF0122 family)